MRSVSKIPVLLGLVVIASSFAWSQDTTPPPADAGKDATASSTPAEPTTQVPEPPIPARQFSPGSGALTPGLGIGGRKQLDISLQFNQSWDSNAAVVSGSNTGGWEPASAFGGSLQLTRETRTNRTLLNYTGNGIAYYDRNPVWTAYQNLGFSQSFKVGRWSFIAADNFNYSPNSPFGGFGFALNDTINSDPSASLKPQYVPNQSILTPTTTSYFNSVLGQVEYGISRRSSWTLSGSYGILRYPDSSLFNTNQITASTGYNRSLTARDGVSLTYTYNQFKYTGIDSDFMTQNVQFGYSHILGGRMSLQAAGGVEFIDSNNLGESMKRVQFSGNGSLNYQRGRTNVGLSYFAGSTGGSGVLTGANTQSVQGQVGHEFGRKWNTSLSVGYSHSSGLFQDQSYDTLYASPGLRRALTRNLGMTFNYTYQRQLSDSSCIASVCGDVNRSLLTFGFDYRFRPISLE
jgi:hypothetical protein